MAPAQAIFWKVPEKDPGDGFGVFFVFE